MDVFDSAAIAQQILDEPTFIAGLLGGWNHGPSAN